MHYFSKWLEITSDRKVLKTVRRKRDHTLFGITGNAFLLILAGWVRSNYFKGQIHDKVITDSPKPETLEPPLISPSPYPCICDQALPLMSASYFLHLSPTTLPGFRLITRTAAIASYVALHLLPPVHPHGLAEL